MGFHHVAIAVKDAKATHAFYTQAMGFKLAKVEVGEYPGVPGSWMKHFFYDTGGDGMIAFWDLHDATLPEDWSPAEPGSRSRADRAPVSRSPVPAHA